MLHLWGSPAEMGSAHGELMSAEISAFLDDMDLFLDHKWLKAATDSMPNAPEVMRKKLAQEMRQDAFKENGFKIFYGRGNKLIRKWDCCR